MIPEIAPKRNTQTIKNYAITRKARRLYAYIQAHGPVTREEAMRAVCGDGYLATPWRVHFCTLLYGARLYAAQFGETIVPTGAGYHRPLIITEAANADPVIALLDDTRRPGRGRRAGHRRP